MMARFQIPNRSCILHLTMARFCFRGCMWLGPFRMPVFRKTLRKCQTHYNCSQKSHNIKAISMVNWQKPVATDGRSPLPQPWGWQVQLMLSLKKKMQWIKIHLSIKSMYLICWFDHPMVWLLHCDCSKVSF